MPRSKSKSPVKRIHRKSAAPAIAAMEFPAPKEGNTLVVLEMDSELGYPKDRPLARGIVEIVEQEGMVAENDNAIPFAKLVEAVGCSEDELLQRLAGILSKRPKLPQELMDTRRRCPTSGDICGAEIETARLRARVVELETNARSVREKALQEVANWHHDQATGIRHTMATTHCGFGHQSWQASMNEKALLHEHSRDAIVTLISSPSRSIGGTSARNATGDQ